jgi:hypothetical protein
MWPFTRDNAIKSLEADTQFLKTPCGLLHQKILADLTILRDRAYKRIMEITSIVALIGRVEETTVEEQLAVVTIVQAWITAQDAEETVFTACQAAIDAMNMAQNIDSAIGREYIISKLLSEVEHAALLARAANLHATNMHEKFLKLRRHTRA